MTSFRFWCRKPAGSHSLARPRLSIRNLINRHISQLTLLQIGTEVIAMSGYQCTALYIPLRQNMLYFSHKFSMDTKTQAEKNLKLSEKLAEFLLSHPEVDKKLPSDAAF